MKRRNHCIRSIPFKYERALNPQSTVSHYFILAPNFSTFQYWPESRLKYINKQLETLIPRANTINNLTRIVVVHLLRNGRSCIALLLLFCFVTIINIESKQKQKQRTTRRRRWQSFIHGRIRRVHWGEGSVRRKNRYQNQGSDMFHPSYNFLNIQRLR